MTTRSVRRGELDTLAQNHHGDGFVLQTTSPWRTRLDPASEIRFRNASGKYTSWISGADVHIDDEWVSVAASVVVLDHATTIEIRGMAPAERDALSMSRPPTHTELRISPDGTAEMIASGAVLKQWVASFFDVAKTLHSQDPINCQLAPLPFDCDQDRAYYHLRYGLRGAPVGSWTFQFPAHEDVELAGEALYLRLDGSMTGHIGWRWSEVKDAEVKSLSGALTLGAIVATAAATALVLPAVVLGSAYGHVGGGHGPSGSARGAGRTLDALAAAGSAASPRGDWTPELIATASSGTPALFGSGARRRAIVEVTATAEASIDPFGADHFAEGGAAVVRLGQVLELGAVGLHLVSRDDSGFHNAGVAAARIGVHLPIDAAHRVALPLSVDIGGGGGESFGVFSRLNWGVRVALNKHAFLGVTPASPTYINWKHQSTRQRAGVMSGLELGVHW